MALAGTPSPPASPAAAAMAGIRRLVEQGRREVTLSVVAHAAADQANSVLVFDTVRLGTYAP